MESIDVSTNVHSHSRSSIPVRVWCVEWNHSGTVLASCGDDKVIKLWKFCEKEPYLEYSSSLNGSHTRTIRKVAFSPCDRYLASAGFDSAIIVYKLISGDYEEVNKLEGQESEIKCCAFSVSGEYLASCSRDKSVWFWQMDEDEDLEASSILQPHTQDVKFVTWHPFDECLVSCSYDCSIVFYRYDGDEWIIQQRIEDAHDSTVWCCDFSGDGNYVVTVGADSAIKVWKRCDYSCPASSSKWKKVVDHKIATKWPFYTVSWNKVSGLIAVAGGDRTLRIFRLAEAEGNSTLAEVINVQWRQTDVNCVTWNPKKPDFLAVASDDGYIQEQLNGHNIVFQFQVHRSSGQEK